MYIEDEFIQRPDFRKMLLENYGYTTINQAKEEPRFKQMKANEIYKILATEFESDLAKAQDNIKKIIEMKKEEKIKRAQ